VKFGVNVNVNVITVIKCITEQEALDALSSNCMLPP